MRELKVEICGKIRTIWAMTYGQMVKVIRNVDEMNNDLLIMYCTPRITWSCSQSSTCEKQLFPSRAIHRE